MNSVAADFSKYFLCLKNDSATQCSSEMRIIVIYLARTAVPRMWVLVKSYRYLSSRSVTCRSVLCVGRECANAAQVRSIWNL